MANIQLFANHGVDSVLTIDGADAGRIRNDNGRFTFKTTDPRLEALNGRRIWGRYTDAMLIADVAKAIG